MKYLYSTEAKSDECRAVFPCAYVWMTLPIGTTFERLQSVVTLLVRRHETLRSTFEKDENGVSRLKKIQFDEDKIGWVEVSHYHEQQSISNDCLIVEKELAGVSIRLTYRYFIETSTSDITLTIPFLELDHASLGLIANDLFALLRDEELPSISQRGGYAELDKVRHLPDSEFQPLSELFAIAPVDDLRFLVGKKQARLAAADPRFEHVLLGLSGDISQQIARTVADLAVKVEDVFLAAWIVLLYRYGDRRPFACSVEFDQRTKCPNLARTLGSFATYIPFSLTLDMDLRVSALIEMVALRRSEIFVLLDDFCWSHLPKTRFSSDPSSRPVPLLFGCHRILDERVLENCVFAEFSNSPQLAFDIYTGQRNAQLVVKYQDSLFSRTLVEELVSSYLLVLDDISSNNSIPIGHLSLVTRAQCESILRRYGHPLETVRLDELSVIELFEDQVAKSPDRIAVVDVDGHYTYQELSRRGEAICQQLADLDLPSESKIAILLNRSTDMVASVIGVWKANFTYVPIEPSTPVDRISFILNDSNVMAVITEPECLERAHSVNCAVIDVSILPEYCPTGNTFQPTIRPDALAYVIYTSGTTGKPKGVMIEHRSMLNLARAQWVRIYANHDDGKGKSATFNAPLAFDGSVERLLLLLRGYTLHIVPDEIRKNPSGFIEYVRSRRIQILDFTPSFLSSLVQLNLLSLDGYAPEVALVGGEAIKPTLWRQLSASQIAFYNVYGPTEATVNSAVVRVAGEVPVLGHVLPNLRLYVLDPLMRPVPCGVIGELYISGIGLARGYLNSTDLTEAAFLPNPFACGDDQHARIYRTGDLGRFLENGCIDYCGRRDSQIKLRGYRIELGEIERVLLSHNLVTDVAVVLRGEEWADKILIAFVVLKSGGSCTNQSIRNYLTSKLPEYMIPSRFCQLAKLPLTSSGKVDSKALSAFDFTEVDERAHIPPSGIVEESLSKMWESHFNIRPIGANGDFFALGGNSLAAVRLTFAINEKFSLDLPLSTLFEAPTIRLLAKHIDIALAVAQRDA